MVNIQNNNSKSIIKRCKQLMILSDLGLHTAGEANARTMLRVKQHPSTCRTFS